MDLKHCVLFNLNWFSRRYQYNISWEQGRKNNLNQPFDDHSTVLHWETFFGNWDCKGFTSLLFRHGVLHILNKEIDMGKGKEMYQHGMP